MNWKSKTQSLYSSLKRRDPAISEMWALGEFRDWLMHRCVNDGPPWDNWWSCRYCSALIQYTNVSIDHLVPLAFGGSSCKSNLGICCDQCNAMKHTLPESQFRVLRAFTDALPEVKPTSGRGMTQRAAFIYRLCGSMFRRRQ